MSTDPRRRTRNLLVSMGSILLFYGIGGIVYAEGLRSDNTPCDDRGLALISGNCLQVWLILMPFVVAGVALILGGLLGARAVRHRPSDELRLSSGVHAAAWILTSLVAVTVLVLAIQAYRQRLLGTTFVIDLVDVPFKQTFLLGFILLAALLAWVPYMSLLVIRSVQWRIFLAGYEAQQAKDAPDSAHS